MKWIIPGPNSKVLAQAIHCLAKLGDDLYIESRVDRLTLRTVNLSKTAFASINFNPEFFSFFPTVPLDYGPECQISMKAMLLYFRYPSTMEKSVVSLALCMPGGDFIVLKTKYKQGIVKTYKIPMLDAEFITTSYTDEVLPWKVVVNPKLLIEWLGIFRRGEVTWEITNNGIMLRNFCDLIDDDGGLKSEVLIEKNEILDVKVIRNTELTFCVSELRAAAVFAEQLSSPITLSFSEAGQPIFFIITCDVLTAQVVLSTLSSSSSLTTNNQSWPGTQSQPTQEQNLQTLHRILRRTEFDITKLPGYNHILAPDSDEDT